MTLPLRRIPIGRDATPDDLLDREWLVTNGRGGYASGSLAGVPTRRFHGLLVAALPAPLGRALMLSELAETLTLPDGAVVQLGGYEIEGRPPTLEVTRLLREVRLEGGIPVWRFELGEGAGRIVVEKRIQLIHMQNTSFVSYRLLEGSALPIGIRTFVSFRPHEGPVAGPKPEDYRVVAHGADQEIHGPEGYPALRVRFLHGGRPEASAFALEPQRIGDVVFRVERDRGYDSLGATFSPGIFRTMLRPGEEVTLVASTEEWELLDAITPVEARAAEEHRRERLVQTAVAPGPQEDRSTLAAELVLAADQFVIRPGSRRGDEVIAEAAGDHVRSVIAGYHWFTDWGRDTMISLEGLTLTTGRWVEAGWILRTFARYVRDGLIPNMFPEGQTAGLYHTADATLWFFHALDRYLRVTNDRLTLRLLLPTLHGIFDAHVRGTHFGIHVDPADGLLSQGEEGYQLTWMDAKVDGWVVTPRRGKAVEINALWFNAVSNLARWVREEEGPAAATEIEGAAERAHVSFNRRFWYEEGGWLHDVIDGPDGRNDPALRPNQILAVALPSPILDPSRWGRVVDVVERELVTPVGLRSLARQHPDYKPSYDGDLRSRDAAYHQGTVWSWLIGPFIDAWTKVHPGQESEARRFLDGFTTHLASGCIGSISEIFDAEAPFTPRGCVAQAWGVAEVLRCLAKLDA